LHLQSLFNTRNSFIATTLIALATITVITACSQQPSAEESAAQSKVITDQAVVEAKKQILDEQASEKTKQDAVAATQAEDKIKHHNAVAEAKKELIAEQKTAEAGTKSSRQPPYPTTNNHIACTSCGVVLSVNKIEAEGQGSGLGVVAGGVLGGLVGNQIGNGTGRDLATIAGLVGGAFAGNKIEKNSKKTISYDIEVRMDSGGNRKIHQTSTPSAVQGDKVKIENGEIVRM